MSAGREVVPMPSLEDAIASGMSAERMTELVVLYLRGDRLLRTDEEARDLMIALTLARWLVWSEANPLARRRAA